MALSLVFFYHGAQKAFGWFGGDGWERTVALWTESLHLPSVLVGLIILMELAAVLGLFFGFFTKLAGVCVFVLIGGALIYSPGAAAFESAGYPLLLMAAGMALAFMGGGYLSIDRAVSAHLLPDLG